jgi:disulfide oxidoreductase YuzD
MTKREEFLKTYSEFSLSYSSALGKADFEYQNITNSIKQYQEIVNLKGEVVDKETNYGKFVVVNTVLPSGNIQKKDLYFYKEDPLTMTIPSGISGYPNFGPFNIDPIDHTGPDKNKKIDKNLLSEIYGNIFSGYTSPVLFQFLEVNDTFSPGDEKK